MSHRTGGLRALLSRPQVYDLYQRLVGAPALQARVVDELRASPGERLLDIGCGPGTILELLPEVDYVGFDLSEAYVDRARARYGDRGRFFCADVTRVDPDALGRFDAVLAHGVIHHLSDESASTLLALAASVLEPGGRLVSVDGCYVEGQNPIAKFLLDRDRGGAIRTPHAYEALASRAFGRVDVTVDHTLLRVPYSLAFMVASDPTAGRRPDPVA